MPSFSEATGLFSACYPLLSPRTGRIIKLIRRIDPKVWLCLM